MSEYDPLLKEARDAVKMIIKDKNNQIIKPGNFLFVIEDGLASDCSNCYVNEAIKIENKIFLFRRLFKYFWNKKEWMRLKSKKETDNLWSFIFLRIDNEPLEKIQILKNFKIIGSLKDKDKILNMNFIKTLWPKLN